MKRDEEQSPLPCPEDSCQREMPCYLMACASILLRNLLLGFRPFLSPPSSTRLSLLTGQFSSPSVSPILSNLTDTPAPTTNPTIAHRPSINTLAHFDRSLVLLPP